MNPRSPKLLLSAFPLLLTPSAHAVLAFSTATWSGDGNINANAPDPGTYSSANPPISYTLASDVTDGTVSINDFPNSALNPTTRVSTTLTGTFNVQLFGGGSGDIRLINSSDSDNGAGVNFFNSINIGSLGGVNRVQVTLSFNEFLASRAPLSNAVNNVRGLPTLAAIGVSNAGVGLNVGNFNTTAVYTDSFSSTDGVNFSAGIPTGTPITTAGYDSFTNAPEGPTFTSDGFTGTVGVGGGPLDPDFLLLRALDIDGDGHDADDNGSFYAKSLTWTITPDSGTFDDETTFVFSLDGQQFDNLNLVPEPSALLSLLFATSAMLLRRRR